MSILSRIFGHEQRAADTPITLTASDFLPGGFSIFGDAAYNDSKIPVSEELSLTVSAVWSAVSCIGDSFAALPAHIVDGKGAPQTTHPLYRLFHDSPNGYMTASTFRSAMMLNALLWGNGYAFIEKDPVTARPIALYPLLARVTQPQRINGQLFYRTIVNGRSWPLSADQVFHVLGQSFDGIVGLSPIKYAGQTVGLSLALERFAARFFGSGANIGGVFEMPPGTTPDAQKAFIDQWRKAYTSLDGAFRVAPLPPGTKFTPTSVDPQKAQSIESRVHQIREVARIFRVPPHKIGDLERATFSNIEQQQLEFQQEGIRPWAIRWEQEANRKLLLTAEQATLELRFNLDSLLRADTQARYTAHNIGLQAGFLTVNEVRARENLPPVEGGDVLRVPLNMGPASGAAVPDAEATPAPTPAMPSPMPMAQRSLIEGAARRLLTKESKAIQRAMKQHQAKPEEFRAWLDNFYTSHEQLVSLTLGTVAPADYAKRHCQASKLEIVNMIGRPLAEITDTLTDWPELRAAEIADSLTTKGTP